MINVLLSGNAGVKKGIRLNILSALEHTKAPIHFYVFTMDLRPYGDGEMGIPLQEEDFAPLFSLLKETNPENELSLIDVSKDFIEAFDDTPNRHPKYSPYTLIRLFSDLYIDGDKLIYLDADTMVNNSLEEFAKIDIEGKELAICLDYMGRFWIRKDYFNAGVIYFNLKECRKSGLLERSIKLLQEKKLYFADQSALYQCSSQRVYMPMDYNEQRSVKKTTVIKHFCKGVVYFPLFKIYNVKQWEVSKVHSFLKMHDFDDVYAKYEKLFGEKLS
ncbi:MAG: hypothetical protein LKF75_03340 [Bacilli bacterium]|jgi:lipopolysaccharide biosynthesis glycosyltransferase|nr:hypothetical protein [Bacilli bacterium]MCH4210307.1 hypothetical protein [Bacilli bacterium]MCH4228716.1 hypothetical protein [Bacilli bacterium]MCI2054797.1 hypothetical protein [Bacilli bacterium]